MIPARIRPLLDELAPLTEAFDAAGHQVFLVGGMVRDLLLGRDLSSDVDLCTDARPERIKSLVAPFASAVWTQGERFGTIGAKVGERAVEITTFRAEAYDPESRKPDVTFGDSIEVDLSRRDFTFNAMALRLGVEPQLIDPFDGLPDLMAKVLRTPRSATQSFEDDPLRMLRAARFVAGLGVMADGDVISACKALAHRLEIVSAERIRAELDRLMVVDDPTPGLWFLVDTGLADRFLPELPLLRVEQDPIHRHKDVLAHTIAVVANTSPNLIVRLAALFHDVGKPRTRNFGDGGVTFHNHDVVGARMTRKRMTALKYPTDVIEQVSRLVFLHLRMHTYAMGWTDSAVRRYVRDAGDLLAELNELTRCDCTTRNKRRADELSRRMDDLEARIAELAEQEELAAIRPDLDGHAVMTHLGLSPGRDVGEALAFLLELRLDEGPVGEAEAYRRLDAWWAARS